MVFKIRIGPYLGWDQLLCFCNMIQSTHTRSIKRPIPPFPSPFPLPSSPFPLPPFPLVSGPS